MSPRRKPKQRPLLNPATGGRIGWIQEHDARRVMEAVRRAREAQPAWAGCSVRERVAVIRAMRDAIVTRVDDIAAVVSRSTGKTRMDALSTDIFPAVLATAHYARIAPGVLRERRIRRSSLMFFNKVSRLTRVPFGVVGIISPWNYPFGIPMHEVVMGLLAGNAVVLKVATQAQPVGDLIDELLRAARLPEGLFHIVHLPGPAAADAMLEAGVDKLFFTGSTATGKEIMAKAAARLVPVVLELGGNDPMIVLDDANLDRAAAGALWAGMSNAGESCAGVERVFVEEAAWEGFRDRLATMVSSIRVGPDSDFNVEVGALISEEQMRKVDGMVRDAVRKGARIVAQSPAPPSGLFHPVIALEGAEAGMRVMREEIFGPVIAMARVRDEQEAIARANDSRYGLSASVWSRNPRRARRVAEQLRVGSVTLNDHLMSHGMPETPWGGFGESGIGRIHGAIGFEEMTQVRVVVADLMHRAPRNMWWYPHDRSVYEGLKAAIVALYGRGLFRRAVALARMAKTFARSFTAFRG